MYERLAVICTGRRLAVICMGRRLAVICMGNHHALRKMRLNETTSDQSNQTHRIAGWVWVRIQYRYTDVIRTRLISILMRAKLQRLEVVRGHSEFLSHFS